MAPGVAMRQAMGLFRSQYRDRVPRKHGGAAPGIAAALILLSAPPGMAGEILPDRDLVPFTVIDGKIPVPLTGTPGDAARGREIAAGRQANCLACHHMPIPEQPFHGDLGPDLAGVADRLTEGALRLRLVDPKRIGEASVMPAFYHVHGLTRVARRYRDRPILAAQQVEDVIAYLMTLTEP